MKVFKESTENEIIERSVVILGWIFGEKNIV
jgi:hypothetical protein